MNRRQFVRVSSAAVAAATFGSRIAATAAAAAGGKIPVGVQLYSVREQCAKDLRKLLDDLGLVACGTHTPYESVLSDKLAQTIEFNHTIGNKFLIVPWMEGKSKQAWLDKAKLFNELAEKVKADGMRIGYHAHAHDFQKFDGDSAWDLFFGGTKPEVIMQLDTSNCVEGGADPVAVLKKYPGRAKTIHIKANGNGPEAVYGEDKVDWKGVFEFCETKGGTEWYVVEHESSKDPIDAVRRCYAALKHLGKV